MDIRKKQNLKKILKPLLAIDRLIQRLLGGSHTHKPEGIVIYSKNAGKILSKLQDFDKNSFLNRQKAASSTRISKVYLRLRDRVFSTTYHAVKRVVR